MLRSRNTLLTVAVATSLIMAACASIGHPEGGPRDMTPPVFVGSNPAPGSLNFKGNRITVDFDENIQLEDPVNKILISPPMGRQPAISSNGKRITVHLRDTLQPNTTYTLDFADAVRDLNENNILDGFAIDFSTGSLRDSMMISGMVFEARTLEPAQEMLVGVFPDSIWTDTTLRKVRPTRVTKTNALGQFTIRNLSDGKYRVVAFNDVDRDFKWSRTEDVAFYPITVQTGIETEVLPDSLRTENDSTILRFMPDNLLLTWSNENYIPAYLMKYERPVRERLELTFSTPAKTLAEIKDAAGRDWHEWASLEANAGLDTITMWLHEQQMIDADSLNLSVTYLHTDSLEQLVPETENLAFAFRAKRTKKSDTAEGTGKDVAQADSLKVNNITLNVKSPGSLDLRAPIIWESSTPIESVKPDGLHLEIKEDTIWKTVDIPIDFQAPAPYRPRVREWKPENWNPGARYRLTIDSLAVTDYQGRGNNPIKYEFSTKTPEDYGAIYVNVHGLDSLPAVAELLQGDNVARIFPVIDGLASLTDVNPGPYYLRLFIDRNNNGIWDAGSPLTGIQPEDVSYYNKKINMRKNWDVEIDWDINALPIDEQKPTEIKKNKPPRPKWETESEKVPEIENDDQWEMMTRDPFFRSN